MPKKRLALSISDETVMKFIQQNAKKNNRSISQEINYLIQIGRQEVIKDRELMDRVKAGSTQFSAEFGGKE